MDQPSVTAPIVFLHWGDSPYLPYTLSAAVRFNPDKRVILLGDGENAAYTKVGIEHRELRRYLGGPEHERFEKVFRYIAGKQAHGSERWLKFNFQRWIFALNFLREEGIERYWTFDTDTLILSALGEIESRFLSVDCTEQCNGLCMCGYISSRSLIERFSHFICDLFERPQFVAEWEAHVEKNPTHSYTEMSAYERFRDEAKLKTVRLNAEFEGTTFDDCICQPHAMETYEGTTTKKIFFGPAGSVFTRSTDSRRYLRLKAVNMSWAPNHLYGRIYKHAVNGDGDVPKDVDASMLRLTPLQESRGERLGRQLARLTRSS